MRQRALTGMMAFAALVTVGACSKGSSNRDSAAAANASTTGTSGGDIGTPAGVRADSGMANMAGGAAGASAANTAGTATLDSIRRDSIAHAKSTKKSTKKRP